MAVPSIPATANSVIGEIEEFLRRLVADLPPQPDEPKPGRPQVLPALALWSGLVVCVLRGFSSQLALWRLLTSGNFWFYPRFPVSDQAVYDRLERAGTAPLEWLFTHLSALLATRLLPYSEQGLAPFATAVVAIDQTTLDPVARTLPSLRSVPSRDHRLLPGKLAGVFDLRLQQWRQLLFVPDPEQNEKITARDLLVGLARGTLILFDLGYFAFPWFDELTDAGYHWISRLKRNGSIIPLHTFYQDGDTLDQLIWLGAHKADRAKHAVRLVQFQRGTTLCRYITNVTDPRLLPMREVARLYARRWDIEMAVNLVKTHLHLHLLWSAKPVVIQQQIWAVLIIAQILQAMRQEIAGRAGVDPFEVSLPLLVDYAPRYAAQGLDPVTVFVEQGRALRFIRPSRRTVITTPAIDPARLALPPPDLVRTRTPRYANKTNHPRIPSSQ